MWFRVLIIILFIVVLITYRYYYNNDDDTDLDDTPPSTTPPPPTPVPSPPPSPNPLGEPMFFPSYVNDITTLISYLRPLCSSMDRATFAIPWDCDGQIFCNYFSIPFYEIPCTGINREGKYSFVSDGCVPEWQSDCPYYPLNIL